MESGPHQNTAFSPGFRGTTRVAALPSAILGIPALTVLGSLGAVAQPQPSGTGKTEVLWLGQSAFRITTPGGKVIVTDFFIDVSSSRNCALALFSASLTAANTGDKCFY